jgi:hypothetical protein
MSASSAPPDFSSNAISMRLPLPFITPRAGPAAELAAPLSSAILRSAGRKVSRRAAYPICGRSPIGRQLSLGRNLHDSCGRQILTGRVLSADSVAASNHDDPVVIQGIIDRSKRLASPFGGPALLRQYYKHVQLASLAWVVARIEPSWPEAGGWNASSPARPTSRRFRKLSQPASSDGADAVHLRAEAFTQSPDEARAITDRVNVFVALSPPPRLP